MVLPFSIALSLFPRWGECMDGKHIWHGVWNIVLKPITFWWVLCFESWNLSRFDGRYVLDLQTYHVSMSVMFWILKPLMFWYVLCFESHLLAHWACLEQVSQSLQIPTISRIYNLREKLQISCKLAKLWFPEKIHHSPISRKKWDFKKK